MEEQRERISPTVKNETLYRNIEYMEDPMAIFHTFDQYPLDEIRQRCLKQLKRRSNNIQYSEEFEWLENHIRVFLQESRVNEMAYELLSSYLYQATHVNQGRLRALKFAFQLDREDLITRDRLTKLVYGTIMDHPNLYWQTPAAHELVARLIHFFLPYNVDTVNDYSDITWIDFERAIRIILKTEDITFIQNLQEIQQLQKQKRIIPCKHFRGSLFPAATHPVIVGQTIKQLQKLKKELVPNWRDNLIRFLKKKSGFTGQIQIITSGFKSELVIDEPALVTVQIVPQTEDVEPEKLAELKKLVRQMLIVVNDREQQHSCWFNDELLTTFNIPTDRRGMHRLYLDFFKYGDEENPIDLKWKTDLFINFIKPKEKAT